jgi:hypothetical protein
MNNLQQTEKFDYKSYVFSPSSLVDWERHAICKNKWFNFWARHAFERQRSIAQEMGLYFEYLCLGMSPYGTNITEISPNKDGSKSAMQVRIERQAEAFKRAFTPGDPGYLNQRILYRHLKITSMSTPKMRGIIDFVAEDLDSGELIIYDLKLVADQSSVYTPQPWGRPDDIDPIQLGTYKTLVEEKFKAPAKTKYMLFEHGTQEKRSIIDVNIDEHAQKFITRRYVEAYNKFNMAAYIDFEQYTPSVENCRDCTLKCNMRFSYDSTANID